MYWCKKKKNTIILFLIPLVYILTQQENLDEDEFNE